MYSVIYSKYEVNSGGSLCAWKRLYKVAYATVTLLCASLEKPALALLVAISSYKLYNLFHAEQL